MRRMLSKQGEQCPPRGPETAGQRVQTYLACGIIFDVAGGMMMLWMAAMLALSDPQAVAQKTTNFPNDWDFVEQEDACAVSIQYNDKSQFVIIYNLAESYVVIYSPEFTWVKDGELYQLRLLKNDLMGKTQFDSIIKVRGWSGTADLPPSLRIRITTGRLRNVLSTSRVLGIFQEHKQLFSIDITSIGAPLAAAQVCAEAHAKKVRDTGVPIAPSPWGDDSN